MIRLKHRQYPVWITWEGDPKTFDKVKNFLLEDIRETGFSGFDAMADVSTMEGKKQPAKGSEEDWDNHIATKDKGNSKKSSKPKGKTLGESTSNNSFVE